MAEYIEREAAIEALVGMTIYDNAPALNAAVEKEYHNRREWIGGVRDALIEIGDLPAADVVERKRGKWEHLSGDEWICNQCGFVLSTEGSWEHPLKDCEKFYCEHCGADMREENAT